VTVRVANDVALYALNQKRRELTRIETDYSMSVTFEPATDLMVGHFDLERTAQRTQPPPPKPAISFEAALETPTDLSEPIEEEEHEEFTGETERAPEHAAQDVGPQAGAQGSSRKRRRRRRGRGSSKPQSMQETIPHPSESVAAVQSTDEQGEASVAPIHPADEAMPEGGVPGGNGQQPSGSSRRRRRRR
jgi:ribonuclease E